MRKLYSFRSIDYDDPRPVMLFVCAMTAVLRIACRSRSTALYVIVYSFDFIMFAKISPQYKKYVSAFDCGNDLHSENIIRYILARPLRRAF